MKASEGGDEYGDLVGDFKQKYERFACIQGGQATHPKLEIFAK